VGGRRAGWNGGDLPARAQALNFQIASANKCRVDKRGKTNRANPLLGKGEGGGIPLRMLEKARKESRAVKTGAIMARKWSRHT